MYCILCFAELSSSKSWDYNLVEGKQKLNIREALRKFEVRSLSTSKYICRLCLRHLLKIDASRKRVDAMEKEARWKNKIGAEKHGIRMVESSSRRSLFDTQLPVIEESFRVDPVEDEGRCLYLPIHFWKCYILCTA